jgi:hypothetical protein
MGNEEIKRARKAIAMLLDYAVHDCEKDDETIDAVEYAMNVLRERPNEETVQAMMEGR